jgi:hypothetical protein
MDHTKGMEDHNTDDELDKRLPPQRGAPNPFGFLAGIVMLQSSVNHELRPLIFLLVLMPTSPKLI